MIERQASGGLIILLWGLITMLLLACACGWAMRTVIG